MFTEIRQVGIVITGSGSLATEVIHALAVAAKEPLTVALLGRDGARLAWLARSAGARAVAVGGRLRVTPVVISWADESQLCRTIQALQPKVLLHTASLQSPWTLGGEDGWSSLVRRCGYGITLPLHTSLTLKIGRVIERASPATQLVNACYPDAVNHILCANRLRVACGIGNVAILAALLMSELRVDEGRCLRVIAHHAHVAAAVAKHDMESAPLMAWVDEEPIHRRAARWLREACLPANLNSIVAAAAVPVLLTLAGYRSSWNGHSAGPLGLIGGYPVTVTPDGIELDLPHSVTLAEAVALNMAAAASDGVIVKENGEVVLADVAALALARTAGRDTHHLLSWNVGEVEALAAHLLALRELLRSQ